MKARTIFALSVLIPFALLVAYVWMTATALPCRDDLYIIIKGGPVEHYLKGALTFSDLWRPDDGQRFLGYNLLMLANVKWFSLNCKIFALLIPFFLLAAVVLIYREYRKSLLPKLSPEFIAATFFMIALIVFNVIQRESLVFGYALSYQSSMPFFIAAFLALEFYLFNGGTKSYVVAVLLSALAVLVFSGKLYIVFAPALGMTFLSCVATRRDRLTQTFWRRALGITVLLGAVAIVYAYRLGENDYNAYPVFYAKEIFAQPLDALRFLLAAFGSSVLGIDVFFACDYISFEMILGVGLFVVILYFAALYLFFRSRMYENTYLPFFLIMQTLFYLVFMAFRRFGLGLDYGMASRFTYVSLFSLAAMIWVFIYAFVSLDKINLFLKGMVLTGWAVVFAGLILTSVVVWRFQPAHRAFFDELSGIAMRVDTATPDELWKFGERPDIVRGALRLLREYRLNVYQNVPVENPPNASLGGAVDVSEKSRSIRQ